MRVFVSKRFFFFPFIFFWNHSVLCLARCHSVGESTPGPQSFSGLWALVQCIGNQWSLTGFKTGPCLEVRRAAGSKDTTQSWIDTSGLEVLVECNRAWHSSFAHWNRNERSLKGSLKCFFCFLWFSFKSVGLTCCLKKQQQNQVPTLCCLPQWSWSCLSLL